MRYKNLKNLDKNQCGYLSENDQLKAIMSFPSPYNYVFFTLRFLIPKNLTIILGIIYVLWRLYVDG